MKLKPESIFCFPHINKLSIRTRRIVQIPFNKFYLNFVEHEDLGIGTASLYNSHFAATPAIYLLASSRLHFSREQQAML